MIPREALHRVAGALQGGKSLDLALVAITVTALGLRLYRLDEQSIWADELQRIMWSKGFELAPVFGLLPSELGVRLEPRDLLPSLRVLVGHNPPLYGTVLHAWMAVFGSGSDFALRLPSALFGVATVVAVYLAVREIRDATAARWAALIIAVSPFHVFYSQEINHYTLATALVALSFALCFRRLNAPNRRNGLGLFACVLGGLLTHYFSGVVFAFQALGSLAYRREDTDIRRRLRRLWPYAASLAAFAPYALLLQRQLREMTDPAQVGHFGGLDNFLAQLGLLAKAFWLGEAFDNASAALVIALGATAIALAVAGAWRTRSDRGLAPLLLAVALGPIAAVLALFWVAHVNSLLWPRYHLLFTPGLVIAAAIALPRRLPAAALMAAILVAANAVGLHALYYGYTKESWKQAASVIDARADSGDTVIVYRSNLVYALAHYLQREPRLFGLTPDAAAERTTALASRGHAVWFVSAWQEGAESTERFLQILRKRFRHEEVISLAPPDRVGTRLYRFSEPVVDPADASCLASGSGSGAMLPPVERAVIDSPARMAQVKATGELVVSGWAFSTREIRNIVIRLNGAAASGFAHPRLPRDDVALTFKELGSSPAQAGFWTLIASPSTGDHVADIAFERCDGTISEPLASVRFRVAP